MRALAALAAGFAACAATGLALGVPLEPRLPSRRRLPTFERRRRWLRQAGTTITPGQFYVVSATAGAFAFVLVWAATSAPLVALVPAVLATTAPQAYYGQQRRRRLTTAKRAWPDGLRDVIASVTAGLSLHHALCELAMHGPAALRDAFAPYPVNARMSGAVPALELVKEELADPTSDRVIEVLVLAKERGPSDLPRILDGLAQSITRDLRTAEEIETAQKEPKINMVAAAGMPWLVLVATTLGETPQRAFYASGRGAGIVIVSALLTFVGIVAVRALSRDAVEARLFVGEEQSHG